MTRGVAGGHRAGQFVARAGHDWGELPTSSAQRHRFHLVMLRALGGKGAAHQNDAIDGQGRQLQGCVKEVIGTAEGGRRPKAAEGEVRAEAVARARARDLF